MFGRDRDWELRAIGWLLNAIGVLTLAVGAAIAYYGVFHPLRLRTQQCVDHTASIAKLLSGAAGVREEHAMLSRSLAEIEQRTKIIRERIPDEPREAQFLREVTSTADRERVKIRHFQAGAAAQHANVSKLTLDLSLEGDYASLCGFFDGLARIPRIATIEKLDITAPAESTVQPVEITLMLYFGMQPIAAATRSPQNGAT